MSGPSSPYIERRVALLPKGECTVLGIRLREVIPELPELEQRRLLLVLRQLVERYAAQRRDGA